MAGLSYISVHTMTSPLKYSLAMPEHENKNPHFEFHMIKNIALMLHNLAKALH